ncbi:hypothetical protein J2X03_003795 [Microbacterium trichothecenolyticum]|uniref:hypothetical protein n=1 Tax=Microbacterium trichothecenolyticum TaxID=69370 RepID=UPI00285F2685|nr:hypothetical protein [Microbacterium trichothecenolyticum]MDR7113893.1 hypothetical protein [Microbacterium trichothecenolyticum]
MSNRTPRIGDSRRTLADAEARETPALAGDPDLHALVLTIGLVSQLTTGHAPTADWDALTAALVAEHTPVQLARMLTGAAALIARTGATA